MGPGNCFGEIALRRDVPRTATVIAARTRCCRPLSADFLTAMGADPEAFSRVDLLVKRRIVR